MSNPPLTESHPLLQVYRESHVYEVVEEHDGVLTLRNRYGLIFKESMARLLKHGYHVCTANPVTALNTQAESRDEPTCEN